MKIIISILLLIISYSLFSQTVRYSDLRSGVRLKTNAYTKYVSEHGETYSVGDKIKIGYPSGDCGYESTDLMMMGTVMSGSSSTKMEKGNEVTISNIFLVGYKKGGYKAYIKTRDIPGINIEKAIKTKEIESDWYNSEDAKYELQKLQDEYELELITTEEYNKRKAKLNKNL